MFYFRSFKFITTRVMFQRRIRSLHLVPSNSTLKTIRSVFARKIVYITFIRVSHQKFHANPESRFARLRHQSFTFSCHHYNPASEFHIRL